MQVELEASQEHAQTLQAMLDEVTPLRRHLKRHIRYRLKQVDQRITNTLEGNNNFSPKTFSDKSGTKGDAILQSAQADDAENFAAYNMPRKPRRTLSIYKASKEAGLAGFAKVKKKRNKKDDEA